MRRTLAYSGLCLLDHSIWLLIQLVPGHWLMKIVTQRPWKSLKRSLPHLVQQRWQARIIWLIRARCHRARMFSSCLSRSLSGRLLLDLIGVENDLHFGMSKFSDGRKCPCLPVERSSGKLVTPGLFQCRCSSCPPLNNAPSAASCDPKPPAPGLYHRCLHRRPLFEVNGQVIRSWNEAHALHGPAHLEDINPAYVAAPISGNMNAGVAPYKRIRRLPRAVHVRVELSGMSCCHSYDPLAGGAAAMELEALHHFLRRGLVDHVQQALERHAGAIGCEHSSGLDSNAVLGALIHGIGVTPSGYTPGVNEGWRRSPTTNIPVVSSAGTRAMSPN